MMKRIQGIVGASTAAALMGIAAAGAAEASADAAASAEAAQSADIATLDSLDASLKAGGAPLLNDGEGPTANATVNLLRLLVKQGVLSHEDAVVLIRQAEQEAVQVKSQADAVRTAASQIQAAAQSEIEHNESDIRITYIPETVKAEIAEDVSHNVMDRARRESWASPIPGVEWISRLSLFADFRMRYESVNFPSGNGIWGQFPDFNAINTGSPFETTGLVNAPQLNAWENRNYARIRARFGFEAQMEEGISLGVRLATGSGSSPVSTNQTLGSPGNFSRYQIWLDRAFLRWDYEGEANLSVSFGRFENPFFSTEIVWDDDIGFDGVAVQLSHDFSRNTKAFFTTGVFPVFSTSLNLPIGQTSNDSSKFQSENRYLMAVQAGVEQKITKDIDLKFALGYYHFENVQGQKSAPFTPKVSTDAGSTDGLRPTFAQKGNTYMALRDIVPGTDPNTGNQYPQWQYYGLAAKFSVLSATGKIDFNHFEPFKISLFGEFIHNFGGDRSTIEANNPIITSLTSSTYEGGNQAWIVGMNIGDSVLDERWKWRFGVDYRYMESDSFIDGFVGSDFGLGGTNLKGVTVGGQVALFKSVRLSLRWMGASEVSGPRYRVDVFQLDLSTQF